MADFRESDILKWLVSSGSRTKHVIEGVAEQDDAAVLAIPSDSDLCATSDFVRGTGFALYRLGHLSTYDLGRYVVGANISDLAAMGATPLGYLSVVRYKASRTWEEVEEILLGISDACEVLGCPLIGGDSGSYEADVLSGTALGIVPKGRRLSRSTFQPGHVVMISGAIGGAAAALAAAQGDLDVISADTFSRALERWRRPAPRLELGKALVNLSLPIACMDISDGLTASLQQLARITGFGFSIDAGRLPIEACVQEICKALDLDRMHVACGASVDFELLVGCAPEHVPDVLAAAHESGTALTPIGTCQTGDRIQMIREDGSSYTKLPGTPWDHQTEDISRLFDASA